MICYNWQSYLWGSVDHPLKIATMGPFGGREVISELCWMKIALNTVGKMDQRAGRFVGTGYSDVTS